MIFSMNDLDFKSYQYVFYKAALFVCARLYTRVHSWRPDTVLSVPLVYSPQMPLRKGFSHSGRVTGKHARPSCTLQPSQLCNKNF